METTMAGSDKKAGRLAKHLGEPIDAACSIVPPGSTNMQIGAGVGGAVGAAIAGSRKPAPQATIKLGRAAWLGLGPAGLVITGADLLLGKPKGEPIVRSAYTAARTQVTRTKLTLRVDIELEDGRALAFEVKRIGPANRAGVDVVELLAARCG
jgi:hypothetical protein